MTVTCNTQFFKNVIRLTTPQIWIYFFVIQLTPSFGQTGEEILNKYLDTVSNGNVKKWDDIKSLYVTSSYYFSASAFQSQGKTMTTDDLGYKKLYKIWPDKQKEELYRDPNYSDVPSKFYFLKNKHVIILNITSMPPMETPVRKSLWFEFYPKRIQQYIKESKEINFIGEKEIPGKTSAYYEVEIKTKEENHYLLFNKETYLLEGKFFPDKDIYWIFSDYKETEGYLIPMLDTGIRDGIVFFWVMYNEFKFNIAIDPKIFIPPN